MTIAPGQGQKIGVSVAVRTIMFWVMMIALALVLWKMASNSGPERPASSEMTYSDFMANVDLNNIRSAKLLESAATAEIQGQLCNSPRSFSVTVPKEVIPNLTEKLRKQGAIVEVREIRATAWLQLFVEFSPVLAIVGILIFIVRLQQKRRTQPESGNLPNGPLG